MTTNLVTNPSFETGITGWGIRLGGTRAQVTDTFGAGASALGIGVGNSVAATTLLPSHARWKCSMRAVRVSASSPFMT